MAMSRTTPDGIRTRQRKRSAKAKHEPAYRLYALDDKISREEVLTHAWRLVKAHRGSPGVDGISVEVIEHGIGADTFLRDLARDRQDKTYRAQPVRRVRIPKAEGSLRPLGIPTGRDRVAQMAVTLIIEPLVEADFCPYSCGFRPKKSAHDAVDDIANTRWAGDTQVIDADLSKYVDSMPHATLMAVVAERIVEGGRRPLITPWLKAPVIGEDDNGVKRTAGGGKANRTGTPHGGVISPLLANCDRPILDRTWPRRHGQGTRQAHLVRDAEDLVVLGRHEGEEPLNVVRHVLERLGLSLNEAKTQIVDATQASVHVLGVTIQMRRGAKTGQPYPNVRPADTSLKKIKARLTELTGRELTAIPLGDMGGHVHRSLRGWANDFHDRNSSRAMRKGRTQAEDRLRTHLMKRHKIKDRGTGLRRFPHRDLYERYGL